MEVQMKNRSIFTLIIILLVLLPTAGCDLINNPADANQTLDPILASGVIEADQVNIASELSGRITKVHVEEGFSVAAGDLVISLEGDFLSTQKTQAEAQYDAALAMQESAQAALVAAQAFQAGAQAALTAAEVQRDQVLAQIQTLTGTDRVADWRESLPVQIELPAWFFEQTEKITAAKSFLELAWNDYLREIDNLQELTSDLGGETLLEAEIRLATAQTAFQVAVSLRDKPVSYWSGSDVIEEIDDIYDAAKTELEEAQESYFEILDDSQNEEILNARAKVSVARERYDLAQEYLYSQYTGPYAFDVQVAEALVAQTAAGVSQAEAQVTQAENSLASAEAAVKSAEAARELINLQIERTQLYSPISGVVLSRLVEDGELISAGYTALTIGDLNNLTVTVYLPENRYGQISLADQAQLSVDAFPELTFEAEVIYISDEAEYTPRNVQTQEERQNTVYAVKLRVINKDDILKPGMPADVVFNP
jgi:multidrug resistance efflux pump